jgi:FkbM family methyltransferase
MPRRAAIRRAALLPPAVKSRFGRQIARLLEQPTRAMGAIETNLGITRKLRLLISADAHIDLFYGTPETIAGEASALSLARVLAPLCDVFVDVGANHGLYLFVLRSEFEIPAHFIEPNPDLYAEIEANVTRVGLRDVQGHRIAIGDREDVVRFNIDLDDPTMSSIVETYYGNRGHALRTIHVKCTTFDAFAVKHRIANALVKVDVEGAAHLFVAGAAREFGRIAYLIIEPIGSTSEMLARVPAGLHCYYINGARLERKTAAIEYQGNEWNWLLCWQRPEELQVLLERTGFQVIG